jgi:hypothetical protein
LGVPAQKAPLFMPSRASLQVLVGFAAPVFPLRPVTQGYTVVKNKRRGACTKTVF